MKTLYKGKTKDVLLDEKTNERYLLFKDSATGENGVFDPGSNTVGGSVSGKGRVGLEVSTHFFKLMEKNGVPTHFLGADLDKGLMKVKAVSVPKLEFVLRYYTAGSMCRRFTLESGIPFDPPYAEVTLKDDAMNDPLITERICVMKGMLKPGQFNAALDLLVKVGDVLRKELKALNLTLVDFKVEFGFDANGAICVADEITPDIWRVKDENGDIPDQITCAKMLLKRIAGKQA